MQKLASKKLLFITGTRADFGKLQPLASSAVQEGFEVCFFITGMHMLEKYGLTKLEVIKHKEFQHFEFLNQRQGDKQDTILSKTIIGFSDYIDEIKPDLVVIHGDRIEAVACSLVAATNYYLTVHIEGGEVSGTIDEIFRHCNTKLCAVHLVSSKEAKKRVIQLGEDEKDIYVIGSPELDLHLQDSGVTISEVKERYDINASEYGICIFHPVTSERETIKFQAERLFEILSQTKKYFVVILPNNDPGCEDIKSVIKKLNKKYFRVLPSMRFNYFSELMKNCGIFIGNSSAGVREAPFLGVPSIDIGTRQTNRARSKSIFQCHPEEIKFIEELIEENWYKRFKPDKSYGVGNASAAFVSILKNKNFWKRSLQKIFNENKL
ncbi:UDP-N-acetylglucosamine 2-epimerase [Prochlorococcus sp. AH-716-I05]|nr:UDP-N-acetylglucosamine 2-epimerase [Prochlorococcus sp. AH-716-I05]